ncbi:hypothetical protein GCWU000342_02115 [Shuttleworthella satelles DSM 14600]|uniref:Uncharacterized protein n=1 Tax=Shuttleworthella satelles DSM 14600 TaxID=626523 RepID=C4GDE2_9FIRM|nr:hypothetical protein GCWU000342_02115 [Shuttleworthia satelles DSM 14600]
MTNQSNPVPLSPVHIENIAAALETVRAKLWQISADLPGFYITASVSFILRRMSSG